MRLWKALVPREAPVSADVDFDRLADQFVMSGGHIRNAALRAAFLAADEERPIERRHLWTGARLEYEAIGRIAS
jgi:hypothetical protein